jgi:hypothetical protein
MQHCRRHRAGAVRNSGMYILDPVAYHAPCGMRNGRECSNTGLYTWPEMVRSRAVKDERRTHRDSIMQSDNWQHIPCSQ